MKRLKHLQVVFDQRLHPRNITQFRGAVNAHAGDRDVLFHNHREDGFRYDYPLIQYKVSGGKASIVCVDRGTEAIHHLFDGTPVELTIGGKTMRYEVEDLRARKINLRIGREKKVYDIINWLPFSQDNYQHFRSLRDPAEVSRFLEELLKGNILSFANGVGWDMDGEIAVDFFQNASHGSLPFKGVQMHTVTGAFQTNVELPPGIGLGKGSSIGFGTIRDSRKQAMRNRSALDGSAVEHKLNQW
jgi:hypothetical protein